MKVGHGQCSRKKKFDIDGYGDGDSAGGSAEFRNFTPPQGAEKLLSTVRIVTHFCFPGFRECVRLRCDTNIGWPCQLWRGGPRESPYSRSLLRNSQQISLGCCFLGLVFYSTCAALHLGAVDCEKLCETSHTYPQFGEQC